MTQLLDFASTTGISRVMAGQAALASLDPIEIDASGQGYKIENVDCAAVGAVNTVLTAETTIFNQGNVSGNLPASMRLAQLVHPTSKDTYFIDRASAASEVAINRYNSAGSLTGTVVVDASAAYTENQLAWLSNGNLLVTWGILSGSFKFAVYDKNLNVVVAATVIGTLNATGYCASGVLTATNQFAASYVDASNNLKLIVYNNDGSVATAAFTVLAQTGVAGALAIKLVQLSSNDIAITWSSAYTTTPGLYYAVYQTNGTVTKAATQVVATAPAGSYVELAVLTGFFAICYFANAVGYKVAVFNNAGAQQGTTQNRASGSSCAFASYKLLTDTVNTRFILVSSISTTSGIYIDAITTAGVLSLLSSGITTSTVGFMRLDAAVDRSGRVIPLFTTTNTAPSQFSYAVFNLVTGLIEKNSTTIGAASAGTVKVNQAIAILADFVFSAYYWEPNGTPNILEIFTTVKYSGSAIVGSANSAIAALNNGYVKSGASGTGYQLSVNGPISGTPNKSFDHSSNTPKGNKGTIESYCLSVAGMS